MRVAPIIPAPEGVILMTAAPNPESRPARSPFVARLAQPDVIVGDGAMGTMLYSRGVPASACFDECNLSQSRLVMDIHEAYIQAGAEIIETNTYGANRFKLGTYDLADKVRAINARGAHLARNAREITGVPVFVAGAVGPLGRPVQPLGRISLTEAREIFREQIEGLLYGGVDLIMLETFKDLAELLVAMRAARDACDLPIVAQMSFEADGRTQSGATPVEVVRALEDAGAAVIGANCSTGPMRMERVISQMAPVARCPLVAQPNAGWPEMVGGRIVYVSGPDYMADFGHHMAHIGAKIVGGCCGTTPEHIRELAVHLKRHAEETAPPATVPADTTGTSSGDGAVPYEVATPPVLTVPKTGLEQPRAARGEAAPGTFAWKLGREFVATVELAPPRGINPAKVLAGAHMLHERGIECVDVTDSARGRAAMSMIAVSTMIRQQVGMEVIIHFTTRDRSLLGIQAELLGAYALGHRTILALTGDPPNPVDKIASSGVFDIDAVGLIKMLRRMNQGLDVAGNTIGGATDFLIGCAFDPGARDLPLQIDRLYQKMEAGADFVMTQPFFDMELLDKTLDLVSDFKLPILMGILPLQNARHAEFLHNEVPGITIPEWALARMRAAGANGIDEGVKMGQELLTYARDKVAGAYLMPSFGRYEVCAQVLESLPQYRPAAVEPEEVTGVA
jgi:homocysteine S-methyltransferase